MPSLTPRGCILATYPLIALAIMACSGSKTAPGGPPSPTAPVMKPHPSLASLPDSLWQGVPGTLDGITGEQRFDFSRQDRIYEMPLRADGTGRTRWALWSLACPDEAEVCDMRWSIDGRILTLSPGWDTLWQASWFAIIVEDQLLLSTTGDELAQRTGEVSLYDGRFTLTIGEGTCTVEGRSIESHTAPCTWSEKKDHDELQYEHMRSTGSVDSSVLHWYKNQGVITSPPAHVYRPAPQDG